MFLNFKVKTTVTVHDTPFTHNVINTVIFNNRDGCSYTKISDIQGNEFNVQYDMHSETTDVYLTDTIKIHAFCRDPVSDELILVGAGWVELDEFISMIKKRETLKFAHNFSNNAIHMLFSPIDSDPVSCTRMEAEYNALFTSKKIQRSVLRDTKEHNDIFAKISNHITETLPMVANVSKENGGTMFQNLLSAHGMCGQLSAYYTYYDEMVTAFVPNFPSWLMMYFLADTLHFRNMTVDDVKALEMNHFVKFIGNIGQTLQRCVNGAPYFSDYTLNGADTNKVERISSEHLKRFLSEPLTKRECVIMDDCEGTAAVVCQLFEYFRYFYEEYYAKFKDAFDDLVDQKKVMFLQLLVTQCFPDNKFALGYNEKKQLMELAFYIGEFVSKKHILPRVNVMSANAAAYGDTAEDGTNNGSSGKARRIEMQGHACASIGVDHPAYKTEILVEGTSFVMDNISDGRLVTSMKNGKPEENNLTDLLTTLYFTLNDGKPMNPNDQRVSMFMSHEKSKFYKAVFCQNNVIVGCRDQITNKVEYGVPFCRIHDKTNRVNMPIEGSSLSPGEYNKLKAFVKQRAYEIHPPYVNPTVFMERLKWNKMTLNKGPVSPLDSTQRLLNFKRDLAPCMVSTCTSKMSAKDVDAMYQRLVDNCNELNKRPNLIAVHNAYKTQDSIVHAMQIYIDDTKEIQRRLLDNNKESNGNDGKMGRARK